MSKLKLMSMKKKTLLNFIFILMVFMFLTAEVQNIKFGRKDVDKVQQTQNDKVKQVAEKVGDKKAKEGKVNDGGQINDNKLQSSQGKDSAKVKKEKTPDNKKTQQTLSMTKSKTLVQQKPKSEKSWFHAVDSLFGKDDQPTKSKSQSKPLTITSEATALSKESEPSTVPQLHPKAQQAQPKQSILGELFESNIQKNAEPIKNQQPKAQDPSKEIPTTLIQPEKKDEKKPLDAQEQSKSKPVKQQKRKIEQKKQQEKKQQQSSKQDNNKKKQQYDEKKSDKKQNKQEEKNKDINEDEQEEQDDEVIYPKNSKLQEKDKKTAGQPHKQDEFKYNFTLLLTFLLYTFIIVIVIITIKCTSKSSKAVKAVNIMVDAVGDVFKKRQGYRPTLNEQEITQRQDQITVGYKVDDNKQIFWEKNSVEGI